MCHSYTHKYPYALYSYRRTHKYMHNRYKTGEEKKVWDGKSIYDKWREKEMEFLKFKVKEREKIYCRKEQ